jgi:hypothetical protein
LPKIAENRRKSPKIAENRRKSPKIAVNRRKSPKVVTITSQDVRARDQRSGSVMITPALIKDLKENRARIVAKGGQCNVNLTNVPKKRRQVSRLGELALLA